MRSRQIRYHLDPASHFEGDWLSTVKNMPGEASSFVRISYNLNLHYHPHRSSIIASDGLNSWSISRFQNKECKSSFK